MRKLMKGDKIALIAPSGNPKSQQDINDIVEIIIKAGYVPVYSENLLNQNNKDKKKDIEKYFLNSEVKVILTLRGGFSCNEILDDLDYEIIKRNPKIFLGFSDITNLLIALNKKSGLKTIHGPIFSEKKYLDDAFLNDIFSYLEGKISQNEIFSRMHFKIIKNAKDVEGKIIGGNLFVLNNLIGTDFEPIWKDKILFIESVGLSKEIILSILHHFKQLNVFKEIRGLILGNMGIDDDISKQVLSQLRSFEGFILKTDNFGHVNNNLPIMIGQKLMWDGKVLKQLIIPPDM